MLCFADGWNFSPKQAYDYSVELTNKKKKVFPKDIPKIMAEIIFDLQIQFNVIFVMIWELLLKEISK